MSGLMARYVVLIARLALMVEETIFFKNSAALLLCYDLSNSSSTSYIMLQLEFDVQSKCGFSKINSLFRV
jgi:hypothetical protein